MHLFICITLLVLFSCAPAIAQMPMSVITSPPFVPPSVYPDGVPPDGQGVSSRSVAISQLIAKHMQLSSSQSATSAGITNGQSVAYQPSKSLRRANLAKFVEKTRATDPAGAAKMAQLFAATDIIGLIDQKMQSTYGMRANNVADAYAVWWVSAWMGARGRDDDATAGQMAMVKRQASNALAATPEFAAATDAGKQELAEALLVQAALIQDTIDTYKADPAMLAKARAAIAQGAKAMGLDLSTMTLTDEGFKPAARKSGAADAPPDAKPTALAANENRAPAASNPPYLLMAAANTVIKTLGEALNAGSRKQ